jgi:tetratricopeptide (TPR) repeat protein
LLALPPPPSPSPEQQQQQPPSPVPPPVPQPVPPLLMPAEPPPAPPPFRPRIPAPDTLVDATIVTPAHPRTRRRFLMGAVILAAALILVALQALRSPSEEGAGGPLVPIAAASALAPDAPAPAAAPALAPAAPRTPPSPRALPAARQAPVVRPTRGAQAPAPPAEADPSSDREQLKRWVTEGNLALASGRFGAAGAQFQRAIAADGTAHAAHAGLAEVAYNQGDFPRAALAARRAVSLAPRVAAYRMILAKAYYKVLRYDDAVAQWQKVLELEPANERAQKNIELARAKRTGPGRPARS